MIRIKKTSLLTLEEVKDSVVQSLREGDMTLILQKNTFESGGGPTYDLYATDMRLEGGNLK